MKFQHFILKSNFLRSLLLLGAIALSLQIVKSQIIYPYNFTYDGNPLVRNHGAADPDVHVWNDTVWMYCSQDHQVVNGDTYATMDGYHAFSSVDLVNWTDHGEILHSRDVSWGSDGFMWAPGAARKIDANGKYTYYLYYPHHDKTHNWRIGVATSDNPQGPFTDIGNYMSGTNGIDPACFIDDDGEAYLYFGNTKVAKLKPNMTELAESARDINYAPQEILDDDLQRFHEGAFMHKMDGKYYYSYTNFKHAKYGGWYAMGDSPYGPFKWKGPMAPSPNGAQDHHSIIEFKGQWYYFYHIAVSGIPVNKEGQGRISCFDRLYYNKDGTIQLVVHTAGPTKILKTNAPSGSVILSPPGGAYAPGKIVTVTAISDLGFAFSSWGGDLSGSENPATIVMNIDKSVSANFNVTSTYSLSINSTNGSVSLNPPGGVYNSGTVVSLNPVKDFGYKFSSWSGDLSGSQIPGIITMDSNKSVAANFNSISTYTITSKATNGIIELNPPEGIYEEGAVVSLNAKQDFGYQFNGWSGDLSGMNNPAILLMNSGKNITANFSYAGEGKIVFATNGGGKAFRSGEGVYYSADSKYSGGGTYSSNQPISGTEDDFLYQSERMGNNFSYKIPLPNKDYKVILMFAEIFHGSAGSRVFDVFIEGIKVSSNLDIWAKVGKNSAYTETHTVKVSDGTLNISFTTIKDNAKISAIKVILPEIVPYYTLQTIATNGSITMNPLGGTYKEDTVVSLTANPQPGFEFSGWSGDKSGSTNPDTITMNGDKSVIALFSPFTGINDLPNFVPEHTSLGQNYPNPFKTETTIPYQLHEASFVKLTIYNFLGQQVATLVNEYQNAMNYSIVWDAINSQRKRMENGLYLYQLETNYNSIFAKKLLLCH